MKNTKKAQTLIEYALVFGIVVVALTAMRVYLQRGIQGVIKLSSDQLGYQKDALYQKNLLKGYANKSKINRKISNQTIINISPGGQQNKDITENIQQSGKAEYHNKIGK